MNAAGVFLLGSLAATLSPRALACTCSDSDLALADQIEAAWARETHVVLAVVEQHQRTQRGSGDSMTTLHTARARVVEDFKPSPSSPQEITVRLALGSYADSCATAPEIGNGDYLLLYVSSRHVTEQDLNYCSRSRVARAIGELDEELAILRRLFRHEAKRSLPSSQGAVLPRCQTPATADDPATLFSAPPASRLTRQGQDPRPVGTNT